MVDLVKKFKIVGSFVKQKRNEQGLSQKALGALFTPAVTTQFISNIERGVTPLPVAHLGVLAKALKVSDSEIKALLEKEYAFKLGSEVSSLANGSGEIHNSVSGNLSNPSLKVQENDLEFMRSLYEAYRLSDSPTRQTFATLCEGLLKVPRSNFSR